MSAASADLDWFDLCGKAIEDGRYCVEAHGTRSVVCTTQGEPGRGRSMRSPRAPIRGLTRAKGSSVSYSPAQRAIAAFPGSTETPPRALCFLDDSGGLTGSHHQKVLFIKGSEGVVAFVGGID